MGHKMFQLKRKKKGYDHYFLVFLSFISLTVFIVISSHPWLSRYDPQLNPDSNTENCNRIETRGSIPIRTLTIRINMPVEYLKPSGLLLQFERLCEVQIRQMQVRPLRWKVSSPYTSSSKVTEPVVHEIDYTLWERLRQYCKILASWSDYTNFTERCRSWEAISSSACEERPRILLNRNFVRTLKLSSFAPYHEPDNSKYILQATTGKSVKTDYYK